MSLSISEKYNGKIRKVVRYPLYFFWSIGGLALLSSIGEGDILLIIWQFFLIGSTWAGIKYLPDFTNRDLDWLTVEEKTTSVSDDIEYKRTCNKCGNTWYVSKEELVELKKAKKNNSIAGALTALSGNLAASAQTNRNKDAAEKQLKELQKCSECRSQDYEQQRVEN